MSNGKFNYLQYSNNAMRRYYMKKQSNNKKKQEKSNQRVKMRSIDEAKMKQALKDEADGNGKPY